MLWILEALTFADGACKLPGQPAMVRGAPCRRVRFDLDPVGHDELESARAIAADGLLPSALTGLTARLVGDAIIDHDDLARRVSWANALVRRPRWPSGLPSPARGAPPSSGTSTFTLTSRSPS